jgi:uncharacterized protein (DUF1499 family)
VGTREFLPTRDTAQGWRLLCGLMVFAVTSLPGVAADLKPCPDTSNCVSSRDQGRDSYVEPLRYAGEWRAAKARLLIVIQKLPRTQVVTDAGEYLHVTFTSRVFGFVDDVEFVFDDAAKVIHVRSASRKGRFDLGVNRRRVESLRRRWAQT